MGDFKRAGKKRFDSRDSRGSGRGFGRRDSGDRFDRMDSDDRFSSKPRRFGRSDGQLTEVTCDKCGKTTTVPFKPSGNKPVYCKDCFRKDDDSERSFSPKKSSGISPEDLDQINEKLDKIMKALNVE